MSETKNTFDIVAKLVYETHVYLTITKEEFELLNNYDEPTLFDISYRIKSEIDLHEIKKEDFIITESNMESLEE